MSKERFFEFSDHSDFSRAAQAADNAAWGQGQGRSLDLRVTLPQSTDKVVGVDLTHIIHTDEVAAAARGGGGSGGGGGGGGGTSSFAPYTSGPTNSAAGFNITIEFKGTWT